MIRISEIEEIMRPNFVWDRAGLKPLQVNEYYEKNKELARIVFVGLCDMYGIDSSDAIDYLDCGYESYRHKISLFREGYKEGLRRKETGEHYDDTQNKIYNKTCMCLNAIAFKYKRNQYIKIADYINV